MSQTLDLAWAEGCNGGYLSQANPQVLLTLSKRSTVKLAMVRAEKIVTGLILAVCRGDRLLVKKPSDDDIVTKSKYLSSSSVTINAELDAGTYVVLCCEGKPVQGNKAFTLTTSEGTLALPAFHGTVVSHSLPMKGEGAAGYRSPKNPQFFLRITRSTEVVITFSVTSEADDAAGDSAPPRTALCFWVQRSTRGFGQRLDDFPTGDARVFESKFLAASVVDGACTLDPGDYVILVMKNAKTASACDVTVKTIDDPDAQLSGAAFAAVTVDEKPCPDIVGGAPTTAVKISDKVSCEMFDDDSARQIVDKVTRALKAGEVFVDTAFPHTDQSINNCPDVDKKLTEAACWRRPAELVSQPALFTDGASADDITQGALGNCWFCATVSAVGGVRPDIASRMFYPPHYNPRGIYAVALWVDGAKKAVIIDDALPARAGGTMLSFARSSDPCEFWFAFVEKAFAKVVGGYQGLMGRAMRLSTVPVMSMMTGGAGSYADPADDETWQKVVEYASKKWLVTTGTKEVAKSSGLVATHAYSVLDAVGVEGFKLVRCRNTWGRHEWTGDWSDASQLWRDHPNVAKACGVDPDRPEDDGNFWMAWTDFRASFGQLNLCRFLEDDFKFTASIRGELCSADEQRTHQIMRCQQIYVEVARPGATLAVAMSTDRAKNMRFVILRAPADGKYHKRQEAEELFKSRYSNKVAGELKLPSDCDRLLLIPATCEPASGYGFVLHSDAEVKLTPAKVAAPASVTLTWPSGGCKYHAAACPAASLVVSAPAPVTLTLDMDERFEKQGVQLALCRASGNGAGAAWPKADLIAESRFVVATSVTLSVPELAAGSYVVRASTHKPADAAGTLTAMAAERVELTAA
eukprot:CAMPEP_0174868156 /NCGR_PEP_ID=MMETSP1114-20130205/65439_1 /TAXON_ID=312471 /ORGANISM="Neobodo designis, Strain CCAP 1951/1" /LENGTH=861 /DNA_ID=CAMNT_0016103373 /DNA_START=71 /DNA_END=2656 /DNA_ORIENTATION=+